MKGYCHFFIYRFFKKSSPRKQYNRLCFFPPFKYWKVTQSHHKILSIFKKKKEFEQLKFLLWMHYLSFMYWFLFFVFLFVLFFFSVFTWEDIPLKEGMEYICCSFLQTEKKISWIQHFVFKIVTAYHHYFQLHQTYLSDRVLFKQYERQPPWYILKRWMHQTCCEIIREFKFMVEI